MGSTRGPNMGPVGDQIEGRVQVLYGPSAASF